MAGSSFRVAQRLGVQSLNSSLKQKQVTPFEERVYSLCTNIPIGKVATYGEMARALNSSPRAVGQALRKNPFAPEVPCHRVIAADL
eukprot:CAMPEP_0113693120 /NCGR_PEP_ID=MMETSP0038_2-20120614/19486_1 /TAXON_ID=2898 /ORGANISM="Cryptomonas paramecium" /LENGTH=85 /DNA_ID=CAMNT_0000615153 /DNA_START=63 /DNA_END=317 /DNA_ORIENTATION=+ /assembly_acc=CAM_ASM_000170